MNVKNLVTLNELKQVKSLLDSKTDESAGVMTHPDIVDMDDLIDLIKHKHTVERLNESGSEMDIGEVSNNRVVPNFYGRNRDNRDDSPSEVESLQKKIRRVLREKDDDAEFFSSKIRQLKRQLKDAMLEKGELAEQVEKLGLAKQRLERFYKEKMGMTLDGKSTFGTLTGKGGELMSEVSVIQRRIEFLEEQADTRNKMA